MSFFERLLITVLVCVSLLGATASTLTYFTLRGHAWPCRALAAAKEAIRGATARAEGGAP